MSNRKQKFGIAQYILVVLFTLSTFLFIVSTLTDLILPGNQPTQIPHQLQLAIEYVSLLTSMISFFALVSTIILGWRRERRASTSADIRDRLQQIRLEKEKLDLERKRLELDRFREEFRAQDREPPPF